MKKGQSADILTRVSQDHGIPRATVSIVVTAFLQTSAKVMISEGKQVDFGFFKAAAIPYRENWREILLSLDPGVGASIPDSPGRAAVEKMFSRIREELCSTYMIDWDPVNDCIRWNISIEPTQQWERFAAGVESKIRKQHSKTQYVGRLQKLVKRAKWTISSIFLAYVKKVAHPSAAVSRSRSGGGIGFLRPFYKKKAVAPSAEKSPHLGDILVVYPDEIPAIKDTGSGGNGSAAMEIAAEEMLPVLNFRLEEEDMRESEYQSD